MKEFMKKDDLFCVDGEKRHHECPDNTKVNCFSQRYDPTTDTYFDDIWNPKKIIEKDFDWRPIREFY